MKITGEQLRIARKRVGLTQEDLADETDFSVRQIARFESNENLKKLNKYYNLFISLSLCSKSDEEKE